MRFGGGLRLGGGTRMGDGLVVSSPSGVLWTPSQLGGLVFIADPDNASTLTLVSSTHISAWSDAAGGALVLTQGTDSARPTVDSSVTLNGRKSAKFTSAGSSTIFTTSGGVSGAAACSVGVVARFDAYSSFRLLAAFGQTATSHTFGASALASSYWAGGASHVACQSSASGLVGSAAYSTNGATDAGLATDTTTAHLVMVTQDGAHTRLYVDGYLCLCNLNGGSGGIVAETYALSSGLGFIPHAAGFSPDAHVFHGVFTNAQMSASDRRKLEAFHRGRFGASLGYSIAALPQVVMGVDSLTYGVDAVHGTSDPLTLLVPQLSQSVTNWNLGIPGRTLATAATNVEYDIAGHTTGLAPSNVVIVLAGTNDIIAYLNGGGSDTSYAATLYAALLAYYAAIKAQSPGCKVVACTLFHCVPSAGNPVPNVTLYNAITDVLRGLMLNNGVGVADAICDLGGDARIVANLSPGDGLHPTAQGNVFMASDLAAPVNSVL